MLIAIEMLLEAGADVFATNHDGESLLFKTCRSSCATEVVRRLLELKVSPTQHRTSDCATPLHIAMTNSYRPAEISKLLVDHGADVDAVDAEGNTALIMVCKGSSGRYKESVDPLIDLGAQVNAQNDLGQTCLHVFDYRKDSYNKNEDQFKRIVEAGANLELRDREGKTVLLNAVEKSNEPFVRALLESSKAMITARTFRHGKTALHLGIRGRSSLQIIETLLEHGADPTWTDHDGNTVLHEAGSCFESYAEYIAFVEKLVQWGVPVHAENHQKRTALHVISPSPDSNRSHEKPSRETFASTLLKLDPTLDINAADIDGYTPLHLAAATSEAQTFRLLRAGARFDVKSLDHRTPLHCASRARQSGIVAMLLKHAEDVVALPGWSGVNAADREGLTPLHDACRSGRPESVKLLLGAGADCLHEGKKYRTPLRVCGEFTEEDKLWSCLTSGRAIKDEFRPHAPNKKNTYQAPPDTLQHDTARIGPIVEMLLDSGATDKIFDTVFPVPSAFYEAVEARCTDMVGLLRQPSREAEATFDEIQLMYTSEHAAKVLDEWKGSSPIECGPQLINKINGATFDAMIAREVDFSSTESHHQRYRTAISAMAGFGLTEKMTKVVHQAKLLDKPRGGQEELRPVLLDACDRPVWNMAMLKILVEDGNVDVNAHQQIQERVNYQYTGNYIPGPAALHILAKGNYWWQVEAIKYLVDHGMYIHLPRSLIAMILTSLQAQTSTPSMRTARPLWK